MDGSENKSQISNTNKAILHLKKGVYLGKYRLKRCLGTGGACEARDIRPFPEVCGQCHGPVDTGFWNYCPWCKQNLAI